jgi:hypothetical protein
VFFKSMLFLGFFVISNSFAVVLISPTDPKIRFNGVIEKIDGSAGTELFRFKKSYIDQGTGAFWSASNAGTQAGMSIQIKTSSPSVHFKFELLSAYTDRSARIFLYRNGVFVKSFDGAAGSSVSAYFKTNDRTESLWTCVLPSFKAQRFLGIELDDGFQLDDLEPKSAPVYVAIGNSITHGYGQELSSTTLTYPWQFANYFGFELYNMAISGSKINTEVLGNLQGLKPDVISVLWGYNDVNAPADLALSMSRYDTLMTQLLERYSKSIVIAIEHPYTTTSIGQRNPSNSVSRLRTDQAMILGRLKEKHSNLLIVSALNYTDSSSLLDAVHLNNSGAKYLADGLIYEFDLFRSQGEIVSFKSIESIPNSKMKNYLLNKKMPLDGHYEMRNISGVLIKRVSVLAGQKAIVSTHEIPQGVYLVKLFAGNRLLESVQIPVQ